MTVAFRSIILSTKTVALAVAVAALCVGSIANAQTGPGGQPPPGAKQSVSDLEAQVAYQRAFEAVLWAMPASAIHRMRVGMLQVPGMADNVIAMTVTPLATKQEFITPNQTTPYTAAFSDLRNGPVVLEVPAKTDKVVLYGQIVDAWQATIGGVGPVGEDKGAGGKYLLLPPGYKEPIPAGYFAVRSSSYRVAFAFRAIQLGGATLADANAYTRSLKMYPLSEASGPNATRFVDDRPYTI